VYGAGNRALVFFAFSLAAAHDDAAIGNSLLAMECGSESPARSLELGTTNFLHVSASVGMAG